MPIRFIRYFFLLVLAVVSVTAVSAQQKDLTQEDYAQWERITSQVISPDGSWFAYQIMPVEGDGWLVIKEIKGDAEHRFDLGSAPRFSSDSAWVAFSLTVSEDERKKLEKSKKRLELSLGLMNLATAEIDTLDHIQSAAFSDDGAFLALRKYKPEEGPSTGADLLIQDLGTGHIQNVGNVSEYAFSPEGSLLAVAIDATEKLGNGIHLIDPASNRVLVLDSDEKTFSDIEWRDESFDLAYLKEGERKGMDYPDHEVVVHRNLDGRSSMLSFSSGSDASFPSDYRIAQEGGVRFSEDGSQVFFGLKERLVETPLAENEGDDDKSEDESDGEAQDETEDATGKTIAERDKDLDPPG